MSRNYVNALVLKNDGDAATLKRQEGPDQDVTFRRGEESREEFLQMFPSQGTVQLFHPEGRLSAEEEKNPTINWITVKVLSNNAEEAFLRFPGDVDVRFHRADQSQSDFLKAWPPGDLVEFQIRAVEHGVPKS